MQRNRMTRRELIRWCGAAAGLGLIAPAEKAGGIVDAFQQSPSATLKPLTGVPSNAIIRTVLRDVRPEEIRGATLFHEHLSTANWREKPPRPKNFREDVDLMTEEMRAAMQDGIGCIVDGSHPEMGQSVNGLKEIMRRSGMLVIGGAGHYKQISYPTDIATKNEDQLLDEMVKEATDGHLGVFGEIGTSNPITADERKVLRAVARAHERTGLPIIGHTENDEGAGKTALEQLDLYESMGVKPQHVVIGHLDGIDDPPLHAAIAKRGAFVGFDRVGSGAPERDALRVRNIMKVIDAGYADRVLLGTDFANEKMTKHSGGPGYAFTLSVFVPKLRAAGVKDDVLHQIMYDNPRQLLAFVPVKA
jgi:phosphotriesterase-related protein